MIAELIVVTTKSANLSPIRKKRSFPFAKILITGILLLLSLRYLKVIPLYFTVPLNSYLFSLTNVLYNSSNEFLSILVFGNPKLTTVVPPQSSGNFNESKLNIDCPFCLRT